jgi:hypothetical protein
LTQAPPSFLLALGRSRPVIACFVLIALLVVAFSAVRFQAPQLLGLAKELTDFDAFHIAGTLAGQGRIADAYDAAAMMRAQHEISSTSSFMPWTYPPPFTLLVEGLARLPIGWSFVLFTLASFGFYAGVLRRIAGEWLVPVLIVLLPIVMLNLRTGQNGFLVAGLIGAFLIAWRENRPIAGLPLGLLIIKPHLAVGVGLMALLGRRWNVVGMAAGVVLAAAGLATWAFGFAVWADFLSAVQEAGAFLADGYYPMFRMSSVYATLLTLGLPSQAALAGHAAVALVAVGGLTWTALARVAFAHRAALVCVLSLFVSPYNYDYDLAILGIALAFVLPELAERASPAALGGLMALAWATGGYGIIANGFQPDAVAGDRLSEAGGFAAICLFLMPLCAASAWLLMRRTIGSDEALPHLPA